VVSSDVVLLFDPEARSTCENAAASSYCVHIHNTNRALRGVPKDIMPCAGSYLESLFASVGVKSPPWARLPVDMIRLPRRIATFEREKASLQERIATLEQDNARLLSILATLQGRIDRIYASETWGLTSLLRNIARPLLAPWRLGRHIARKRKVLRGVRR
jgi:hypothetical protein